MKPLGQIALSALPLALALLPGAARASSHGEGLGSSKDPAADVADFYLFRSPDETSTLTFIMTVWPFAEPASGPTFPQFAEDVRYLINVDSNGDAVEDVVWEFLFTHEIIDNIFYARRITAVNPPSPDWYLRQRVNVTHIDAKTNNRTAVLMNRIVAPTFVGPATEPNYPPLAEGSIHTMNVPGAGGGAGLVFCGPRDDPFFADLGSLFDNASVRMGFPGNMGGGVDSLSGRNVLAIALRVPITSVTMNRTMPSQGQRPEAIVGAWASTERRKVTIRRSGEPARHHGPWTQVARAAIPLVNTIFIPISNRDAFNSRPPFFDDTTMAIKDEILNPRMTQTLELVYMGMFMPVTPVPRNDVYGVFAGNPLLGRPPEETTYVLRPADILRIDVTRPASALDGSSNRLGGLVNQPGFPNGRRLDDDVVDIMLQILGGTLLGGQFSTGVNGTFGDGVDQNDRPFLPTFPYLALPVSGQAVNGHTSPPRRP